MIYQMHFLYRNNSDDEEKFRHLSNEVNSLIEFDFEEAASCCIRMQVSTKVSVNSCMKVNCQNVFIYLNLSWWILFSLNFSTSQPQHQLQNCVSFIQA